MRVARRRKNVRMRLFAALTPPDDAVEDLATFLEPRHQVGDDVRWTDPDQWHVTLAFMAEVPDRVVEAVTEAEVVAAQEAAAVEAAARSGAPDETPQT